MTTLMADLRYALRSLRRRPAYALAATATLALGIGANTAVFSVVNGVLLRPLPYREPGRLLALHASWPGQPQGPLGQAEYWDLREQAHGFEHIAAYADGTAALTGSGAPERLTAGYASADLLPLLGSVPKLGRGFTAEDDLPGRPAVVLLSEGFWRRRFGGDSAIVGRTLVLDDVPATVIGVMPAGFQLPGSLAGRAAEAWMPLGLDPSADRANRGWHYLQVVARLRPGVDQVGAAHEVAALGRGMVARYPTEYAAAFALDATPLTDEVLGPVRPAILVMFGAVTLLLVITCGNVAGLTLAGTEARQQELAVRTALGAGRGRLARQLLTESVVLALAGATAGLGLAVWGVQALVATAPASIPRLAEARIDARVLAFTAAVALLTGLLFGLAPARRAGRAELVAALNEGGRGGTAGSRRQRLRRGLVVGQIALALVLVTGAGLLLRSFLRLRAVDPGFDPARLLTARVELSPLRYRTSADIRTFYDQLLERVRAMPGVEAAAAVRALPMNGERDIGDWSFVLEGRYSVPPLPADWHPADWQVVSPDYFRTLRVPVLQGRGITAEDLASSVPVVVINRTLAARVWPDGNAVGQRILLGGGSVDSVWRTVVGVAGDVRRRGLDEVAAAEMYLPHAQFPAGTGTAMRGLSLAVRTTRDPAALAPALRSAVATLDRDVPLTDVQTMEESLGVWEADRRLTLTLVATFALLALVLGAVGVYGVLACLVAQRRREIGIRIALGATPSEVVRLVLGQGAGMVALGIGLGLAGALLATRVLAGLLYGVRPTDPPTLGATALTLGAVALAASLGPALRAARLDPIDALRGE